MHAVSWLSQLAPDGAQRHYERHRLEQTALYRLVQPRHDGRARLGARSA